jgi:3-deoxy-manno-octulosonate cytidylyltransferase (CMP-KDO synthetase)
LGIVAFRADFLQGFARLEPTPLELIESVDMMRAIEHGFRLRMVETEGVLVGVDVPADVARAERALRSDPLLSEYMART